MARSQKERMDLADLYRGKDLYDPSKDSAQETAEFETPHMMSEGGYCMAHGGYCMSQGGGVGGIGFAEGGPVRGPKKVEKVMGEFGKGKLKSSSGDKVKDRDQAIAIALSEAGMSNKKSMGGPVGYADGGDVSDQFSASPEDIAKLSPMQFQFSDPNKPILSDPNANSSASFDTDKLPAISTKNENVALPKYMEQATAPEKNTPDELPNASKMADTLSKVSSAGSETVNSGQNTLPMVDITAPAAMATQKMTPDQIDNLIASLKPTTGQKIGSGVTQGLATLADALIQGVGRAGPSNISKNIEEQQQNRQQNLINALKTKYETQFRGQELGQAQERIAQEKANAAETARSHKANEAETEKERQTQAQAQALAAQREARTQTQEQKKQNVEAAQKVVDAYQKAGVMGQVGLKEAPSSKDYENALNVIKSSGTASGMNMVRIRDSSGQMHDLPASSLAKAKQRDPGLQVVQ